MKIGIILHPFGENKPGGLARTIFEWTKGLLEIDDKNQYIIFVKHQPRVRPVLPGKNWQLEVLGGGWFWKERLRQAPAVDVYIFQTPALPIFYRPAKSIVITQDYPYEYLKSRTARERIRNFLIRYYHHWSLHRADVIVAVSQSSKADTIRFFNLPEEKIKVVYMGYKNVCAVPELLVSLPAKFFLFVGVIKERKNFFNIVKAFEEFKRNHPDVSHKLVVAGKIGNSYFGSVAAYIQQKNLTAEIIFLEYLNDGQLSYVYRRAEALIFPSLVESFGFPCLEAMSCGVPVITTKYQGPAEIVNGAGILVDPFDYLAIAEAMAKVVHNDILRHQLIEQGHVRSREFSWQKAATQLLAVITTCF